MVEAPAKNGAVVMAEALYQATYEDGRLRLVPKHLAQNRPVVLCGGINVITGPGKPTLARAKTSRLLAARARPAERRGASVVPRVAARAAVRPGHVMLLLGAVVFSRRGPMRNVHASKKALEAGYVAGLSGSPGHIVD